MSLRINSLHKNNIYISFDTSCRLNSHIRRVQMYILRKPRSTFLLICDLNVHREILHFDRTEGVNNKTSCCGCKGSLAICLATLYTCLESLTEERTIVFSIVTRTTFQISWTQTVQYRGQSCGYFT